MKLNQFYCYVSTKITEEITLDNQGFKNLEYFFLNTVFNKLRLNC